MLRTFLWAGGALFLLLGAAFVALFLVSWDDPAPDDRDLVLVRRVVPPESNGLVAFDISPGVELWPEEEEVDGRTIQGSGEKFDLERAEGVLAGKEQHLRKVNSMLEAPDFQVPDCYDPECKVLYLLHWRDLSFLISMRSRIHFERGRHREALDDAIRLVRLGHAIEGAQGPLIVFLVGIAVKSIGRENLVASLSGTSLREDDLRACAAQLERLPPHRPGWKEAMRAENLFGSRVFERFARGELDQLGEKEGSGLWQRVSVLQPFLLPNRSRRLLADEIRMLIRCLDQLAAEREASDAGKKYGYVRGDKSWIINCTGKIIIHHVLAAYEKGLTELDKEAVSHEVARVLLALRRHQVATGRLPETLADLVPAYLEAVPRDPFHGEPLLYDREARIVYSAGTDGIDMGGSSEEDPDEARSDLEEPTFRIPF